MTSYGYDANGNNTRVTDGNGNVWQTTYNSWGLVESRIEPATSSYPAAADRTFTTRYDSGGLPVLELQPGVNVTRTFDNLGRLTGESTADGATRGFAYDLANRPTTVTSGATSISLGYNERSQLVSASGSAGVSSFRYDQVGRPTQRVDAAGTTSYSWRQNGQLNQIGDPVTGTTSTYNWAAPLAANAGQLTSVSTSATTRSYGYDGIGRVISDVMTAGASTLWSASYHYDSAGHVDTKTIGPAGVAGAGANSYGYNLAGQLTGWTDPAAVATAYSYDLAGNRTSNGATAIVFDQRNRIVSEGTKSYAWSARGTLDSITDGASTTSYAFDGLGRMTAVGGTSYSYDGLNRIINRDSTAFTYSGVHNQPTFDGTTVLSRTPDGSPLAIAEGATRLSLLADRHGDVVASMSAAGLLVDSVAYSPWGEPAARQGATALTVGYQSSYTDPTTGLIDMGARWYQASTGTFTNRDTYNGVLSSPISLNRYTYANNNPIDYFDPDGRMSADAAEKYASKGYACSGTKRGPDCQKVKAKPVVTKTADRVQRERDQAVAEATAVERQEAHGGPGIFDLVDPASISLDQSPTSVVCPGWVDVGEAREKCTRYAIAHEKAVPAGSGGPGTNGKPERKYLATTDQAGNVSVGGKRVDVHADDADLLNTLLRVANDSHKFIATQASTTGGCGGGEVGLFGVGFGVQFCKFGTPTGAGSSTSVYGSLGLIGPSLSVSGTAMVSNAQEPDDFDGEFACLSGSFTAAAAVCAGLNSDGSANGIFQVFAGWSVGVGVPGSLTLQFGYTWASEDEIRDMGRPARSNPHYAPTPEMCGDCGGINGG